MSIWRCQWTTYIIKLLSSDIEPWILIFDFVVALADNVGTGLRQILYETRTMPKYLVNGACPWQMTKASPMVIMSLTKQNIQFYLIVSIILFSIISYNCSSCITFWAYERQLPLWHYNSCHYWELTMWEPILYILLGLTPLILTTAHWDGICYYPHFIDKTIETQKD